MWELDDQAVKQMQKNMEMYKNIVNERNFNIMYIHCYQSVTVNVHNFEKALRL